MSKVKIDNEGTISFNASETIPSSPKKFRKSPEISAFYKFIFEHDLQREAQQIIEHHSLQRRKEKIAQKSGGKKKK